ncbi:MAG: hypothetical protein H7A36_02410 [Chlamydiales bacterium]|nr:hypothetical protein [Chlamydiales bacterium]
MIKQLLVFTLVCFGIIQLYNKATDGFSVAQMRSHLPLDHRFNPPEISEEKREALASILAQPYRYLGKGCQFYAFESADGRHVLKFLKQKHLRPSSSLFRESQLRRQARVERLFSSVKLAFEQMPKESGLLYIHLNKVPALKMRVTLIDNVGLRHKVAVDEYEFVLQERAQTAKEVFACASEEEAKARIAQLAELVHARCAKGIRDRDRSFVQNVAFKEDRAVYIDVGQMCLDETIRAEEELDLQRRMGNLRFWMEKHHPEFSHLLN